MVSRLTAIGSWPSAELMGLKLDGADGCMLGEFLMGGVASVLNVKEQRREECDIGQ